MTVLRPTSWNDAAAVAILRRAVDYDTTGGMVAPENCGGALFRVERGGELVAAYVLAVNDWPGGKEGVIAYAAGGAAGVDLVRDCLPLVERQFLGCGAVVVHTRRPGLVRKLKKQGYAMDGYIMRKQVQA